MMIAVFLRIYVEQAGSVPTKNEGIPLKAKKEKQKY